MKASEILAGVPERLTVPPGAADTGWRLADDLLALHGGMGEDTDPVVVPTTAVGSLEPGDDREIGPVYRRVPGGDVVVPTGRVLVRFTEDTPATVRTAALAGAGYRITETLRYAPDTVWAYAAAGGIVGSLRLLDRLSDLPEIRSSQPELIGERSWRS